MDSGFGFVPPGGPKKLSNTICFTPGPASGLLYCRYGALSFFSSGRDPPLELPLSGVPPFEASGLFFFFCPDVLLFRRTGTRPSRLGKTCFTTPLFPVLKLVLLVTLFLFFVHLRLSQQLGGWAHQVERTAFFWTDFPLDKFWCWLQIINGYFFFFRSATKPEVPFPFVFLLFYNGLL